MQKAFERVLGGEYRVVIKEELSELKQSDKILVGEPCAVLYRTDINLGRPADECETDDKSCYIVLLPSKYSIICNKDFGAFKSKDNSIKLVSLNYFVEKLLEFNFTFLQLIEDKAIIWETDDFHNFIENYKVLINSDEYFKVMRYNTLTSIAISLYSDIKAGKIKDDNSCKNRLFMLYIICEACRNITITGEYSLIDIFNESRYNEVKNRYSVNKDMSILKDTIEEVKNNVLNIQNKDKDNDKLRKLMLKYDIMHNLVLSIIK